MNWLVRPLWNSKEGRLRAGWRVLLYIALWLVGPALAHLWVGRPLAEWLWWLFPQLTIFPERVLFSLLTLATMLVGTWLMVRYVDHRPLRDLGLGLDRHWWCDLCFGLILGAGLMLFVFTVEWLAGWVTVRALFWSAPGSGPFLLAIFGPLVVFVVVGVSEELLTRGYQMRNLAEGLYLPPLSPRLALLAAWLLSSLFFGLLHIRNPNSSWISTSYLVLAGLLFGLGTMLTGRLGLPIGLHITWNFFQGNVFGFPVSGNNYASVTFIAIEQQGPILWTGGAFGPEAGLIGIVALLLGGVATVIWVRHRYRVLRLCDHWAIYRPWRTRPVALDPLRPTP